MIETAVVILNWNGKKFLEQFLANVVENSENQNTKVFVVDNASTDESVNYLAKEFPNIETVILEKNYGFAGGYNKGLKHINAEYYILLNSDVEVTPNWVEPLIDAFKKNSNLAACMPKLKAYYNKTHFEYAGAAGGFIDKYGYPFCQGRLFNSIEEDLGQYNTHKEIFWATGAALCIKADIYNELGGLDEDFFAHMEEIDLCWRIKNRGYNIQYIPESTAYHVGGGTLPKENPFKTYLNFRNNLYLLHKNLPSQGFKTILFKRKILDGIAWLTFLSKLDIKNCSAIWRAHIHYYKELKNLNKKRELLEQNRTTFLLKEVYPKSIIFEHFLKKKQSINL